MENRKTLDFAKTLKFESNISRKNYRNKKESFDYTLLFNYNPTNEEILQSFVLKVFSLPYDAISSFIDTQLSQVPNDEEKEHLLLELEYRITSHYHSIKDESPIDNLIFNMNEGEYSSRILLHFERIKSELQKHHQKNISKKITDRLNAPQKIALLKVMDEFFDIGIKSKFKSEGLFYFLISNILGEDERNIRNYYTADKNNDTYPFSHFHKIKLKSLFDGKKFKEAKDIIEILNNK